MTNDPRGTKRHCTSCMKTYYDLDRDPIVCPLCGEQFDPEVLLKSRRARPVAQEPDKEAAAATPDTEAGAEEKEAVADPGDDAAAEEDVLADDDSDVIKVTGDADETDEETIVETGDEVVAEALDGDSPGDDEDGDDGDGGEGGGDDAAGDGGEDEPEA